jgi:CRISPR/Cas system CMR subunit Cmr4 (Cas7 group RAMP superfamily)
MNPRAQEKETKHDSRFSPPDDPIVNKNMEDHAASPVNKGMEKFSDSLEEDLVTSMDISIFASPITSADDTWPTIARDSMLQWDTIAAQEATIHKRERKVARILEGSLNNSIDSSDNGEISTVVLQLIIRFAMMLTPVEILSASSNQ